MNQILTLKQQEIYNFIRSFQEENGKSPTFQEIKTSFQLNSLNSVFKHLRALEKKGYIGRSNEARGIKLLKEVKDKLFSKTSTSTLPLLGSINAGTPSDAITEKIDDISIFDYLIKNPQNTYLLKVSGDSVDRTGIFDGDLVIVDRSKQARQFDIVVCLVDSEVTLKQYQIKNGISALHPFSNNPLHQEIVPKESATIQGVVTGCIKKI